MMRPALHLLTDANGPWSFGHLQLAEWGLKAGADVVQVREKHRTPAFEAEVQQLARKHPNQRQRLVINDYADLALNLGLGLHVGREDLPVSRVAGRLIPGALLGATVHNLNELEELYELEISYIGVGPVYGTLSKKLPLPPLGLEGLRRFVAASPWPVVAIGGIGPENLLPVLDCGVQGVAVLSAFSHAPQPQAAAEALIKRIADWARRP